MEKQLRSPSTGKTLRKVDTRTLTPASDTSEKTVTVQREFVEVIFGDSRIISLGSQWGHVAIVVDDTVYTRAHDEYVVMPKNVYLYGGEVQKTLESLKIKGQGFRDSVGLVLWLSTEEKRKVEAELKRRVEQDRRLIRETSGKQSSYSLLDNSCSTNVADVLELIGILAHDPRWPPTPVAPAELLAVLEKSRRLVKKNFYPKR